MQQSFDAAHSVLRRTGVPRGWRAMRLGELVQIVGGGTPDRAQNTYWREGDVPWITPTDLTANAAKFITHGAENISAEGLRNSNATLAPAGSIVFSTRGTVGNMAVAAVPLTCNQSCEMLVPKDGEIQSSFLYYLLNFGLHAFVRLSGGTTFGAITRSDISRVWFAVPETDEQTAVARILDAADAAIENARRAVNAARKLRSSLLVTLLSSGINEDGHVRVPENGAEQFVLTKLGRLPTSWGLSTVGTEFEFQNGFTLNADRRPKFRKRPYLRVANVHRDALRLANVKELEAHDREFIPRELEVDDLLVVEGHADPRQIGRCARVTEEARGMTFQNHLFRLRASGEVLPGFAVLWLNSRHAQSYWNARCATSSGLNTINQRMLKQLPLAVPREHEQRRIIEVVSAQRAHLESLLSKQRTLEQLKNSLLSDLLTGNVRVSPAHPSAIASL